MMFVYFDVFCPSQNKSVMSGQYTIDGVQTHFISVLNQFIIYLQKYPLILPIFLHQNTKSCITLLAFSDSVSPSSIVYPRRTTFTLVLYLGKIRQRAGI